MGCFSFMCKECDTSIRSDSFNGELVKLFLLKDGKVIQEMEGEYDSYGCVFIDGTEDPTKNDFRKSAQWDCPEISEVDDYWKEREKHGDFHGRWLNVCGLMSIESLQSELDALKTGDNLHISNMRICCIRPGGYAIYLRESNTEKAYDRISGEKTSNIDYYGNYLGIAGRAEEVIKLLRVSQQRASQALKHLL